MQVQVSRFRRITTPVNTDIDVHDHPIQQKAHKRHEFKSHEVISEIEDTLATLKSWYFTEAEGYAAEPWIEWLDRQMSSILLNTNILSRAIHQIQVLCKYSGRLPPSCELPKDIHLIDTAPISSSALSDVYHGLIGEREVAVKVLRIHADNRKEVQRMFRNEVVVWKYFKHPNVVPFIGVSSMFPLCAISRWMGNGTISAYLQKNPIKSRLVLIRDVTRGLGYIHSLQVVHGDLKASNVLVTDDGHACLTDFGLATLVHDTGTLTGTSSLQGTLRWMSPELLSSENSGRPTYASDVYSLAMVLWELMTGKIPFHELRQDMVVMASILEGKRPTRPDSSVTTATELDDDIWALMQQCWHADPDLRPPVSKIRWYHAFVFTSKQSLSRSNAISGRRIKSSRLDYESQGYGLSSLGISNSQEWEALAADIQDTYDSYIVHERSLLT